MKLYNDAIESKNLDYKGERNCCSVIALAICFETPYREAYTVLESVGRRYGKGATSFQIMKALNIMCERYNVTWEIDSKFVRRSVNTLLGGLSGSISGNFIALTCNHALAVKHGSVQDWSKHTKRQVKTVYRISGEIKPRAPKTAPTQENNEAQLIINAITAITG